MSEKYIIDGSTLTDIADAIRVKKENEEPIKCENFADEIENLPQVDLSEYFNMTPTAEEINDSTVWVAKHYVSKTPTITIPNTISNISQLCAGLSNLKINMCPKIICGPNVTDMSSLYRYNAGNPDVSGLNTSNVTKIQNMFADMNIREIDIRSFNLNSLTSATSYRQQVFQNCYYLEKAIITPYIARSLYKWFYGCFSLKILVLLKEDGVCGYDDTFTSCYHMDGTINATYNPQGLKDGRIYVPDNLVNDYKQASGWSTYADQILPLSRYVEED